MASPPRSPPRKGETSSDLLEAAAVGAAPHERGGLLGPRPATVPLRSELARVQWCVVGMCAVGIVIVLAVAYDWESALRRRKEARGHTYLFQDNFDGDITRHWQAFTDDAAVVFTRGSRLVIQPRPMSADAWLRPAPGKSETPLHLAALDHDVESGATGAREARPIRTSLEAPGGIDFALTGTALSVARCNAVGAEVQRPSLPQHKCAETGRGYTPLPPAVSAKLSTLGKFAFTQGTVEVRLRLPKGDWLRTTVSLEAAEREGARHIFSSAAPRAGPAPPRFGADVVEARGNARTFNVVQGGAVWPGGQGEIARGAAPRGKPSHVAHVEADGEDFVVVGLEKLGGRVRSYVRRGDGSKKILVDWPREGPRCAAADDALAPVYLVVDVQVGGTTEHRAAHWGTSTLWSQCNAPLCHPRTIFHQQRKEWLPTWTRPLEIDWVKVSPP
ncbi:hypothetical protein M885DRAFT_574805 [Pelagophyceae sp. CCMP2097]|nr:hypothetical protein M885DRAFT_574805 [Pelagophyceae sp. CCMP2097]